MIANVSRQFQKSRHAAVAVITGGGAAAYAKHLDTAQGINPILNDVHHVAMETITPPISHGVLSTGAVLSEWFPLDTTFATEGTTSSCSAFATENDGSFHEVGLPFPYAEVLSRPPGSPAGQPVSQLPTGIVCCPVLWPVWGFVPLDNRWNLSSGIHLNAFTNSAETTKPSVDIDSCRRTGTSRRQRRRQRECDGRVQIAAEEAIVGTRTAPKISDCSSPSPRYWPPTPQSTPPQSPRSFNCEEAGCDAAAKAMSDARAGTIMAQLSESDSVDRRALIEQLVRGAWPLATEQAGCRVLQKVIDIADPQTQAALVDQLRGHVVEATASPHGNFVLQKCIAAMPNDRVKFVIAELQGHAVVAAKSRSGCRVLERLLEHFPHEETTELVDEVLGGTEMLCRHAFGNFVIQHILEHGAPRHRHHVISVLCADAQRLARHRVASHVMKCALVNSAEEDKQSLVCAISPDQEALSDLAHHHCGSFVVREMKRTSSLAS